MHISIKLTTFSFYNCCSKVINLEKKLKEYQEKEKIKFDAIICVFDATRFKKEEIQPLKDQES